MNKITNCPDCDAEPGQIHSDCCDIERCSICGCQKLGCECIGHDKAFARWTGFWPGSTEASSAGISLNDMYETGKVHSKSLCQILFVKPVVSVDSRYEEVAIKVTGKLKTLLSMLLSEEGKKKAEITELVLYPTMISGNTIEAGNYKILLEESEGS